MPVSGCDVVCAGATVGAVVEAVVREWFPDLGWGVLDSSETPGGCWTHYSYIEMAGYKALSTGQAVDLTWESPGQDGYAFRAVHVQVQT